MHNYHIMNSLHLLIGGGKISDLSNASHGGVTPSTHNFGRFFVRAVQKVAFVVSIAFMLGACEEPVPMPEEETQESTGGEGFTVNPEYADTTYIYYSPERNSTKGGRR